MQKQQNTLKKEKYKRKILFKRNTNFTEELLHFIHGKLGTRKINCGDKS